MYDFSSRSSFDFFPPFLSFGFVTVCPFDWSAGELESIFRFAFETVSLIYFKFLFVNHKQSLFTYWTKCSYFTHIFVHTGMQCDTSHHNCFNCCQTKNSHTHTHTQMNDTKIYLIIIYCVGLYWKKEKCHFGRKRQWQWSSK